MMTCTCGDILDSVLSSSLHSALSREQMGPAPVQEEVGPVGETPAHLGLKNHEK